MDYPTSPGVFNVCEYGNEEKEEEGSDCERDL